MNTLNMSIKNLKNQEMKINLFFAYFYKVLKSRVYETILHESQMAMTVILFYLKLVLYAKFFVIS